MVPRQRQSPLPIDRCHLARAIDVIGDRWSLLILRSVLFGVRRFDDFQAELAIPRSVLSARLKQLSAHGLLKPTPYREAGKRKRTEYLPTQAALELRPILLALTQWSDQHLSPDTPPPLTLRDARTGDVLEFGPLDRDGRKVDDQAIKVSLRA
ncbi:MAG: helix-turn-helix domain-containing protein [Pseudomonadota bacterium]